VSTVFANYSMLTGQRYDHDWYDWCIFASGDPVDVQLVKAVEYTLHPSFPEPVRTISDVGHRFGLASNGWGSFTARIRVIFANGKEEFTSHLIELEPDNWPRKRPLSFSSPQQKSVYDMLIEGNRRWRTAEALQRKTGLSAETVRKILGDLEAEDLVRNSPFRSIDKKELWGASAIVGMAPRL
jgi:transcription initiation factor IIF auxiliary subunit